MVDMKTNTQPVEAEASQSAARCHSRDPGQRRLKLIAGDQPKTIKVFAANEDMRAVLRHPNRGGGIRFRDTLDQGVEWPNDSYTQRRIADGSVRIDGPASGEDLPPVDESLNPRQQSAARKAQTTKAEDASSKPPKNGKAAKSQHQPQPEPHHPAA